MNARESLSADRIAEDAINEMLNLGSEATAESVTACALVAIALELRAQRVYANYLEGRQGTRWNAKRQSERAS